MNTVNKSFGAAEAKSQFMIENQEIYIWYYNDWQ